MKIFFCKIGVFFLLLCLVLTLSSCDAMLNFSSPAPTLVTEDISNNTFYVGKTYKDFTTEVTGILDITQKEVNVIVDDCSVAEITFEKKKTLFSNEIVFSISALKVGTTSFYFEIPEDNLKSNPIEINILQNISAINFSDTSDISLFDESEDRCFFSIDYNEYASDLLESIEFISENPEVATIKYDEDSWFSESCIISGISPGETLIYIQTKDGSVQSQKIKVIIINDSADEEPPTTTTTEPEPEDNGKTVYVTPYGKKYHYSKSCAGKNASETSEQSAKITHDPCKKCVK